VPTRDPITHAYFRELDADRMEAAAVGPLPDLGVLLRELGVTSHALPALPEVGQSELRTALRALPPALARLRQAELVYLANVLVASPAGHTPFSAAQAALASCARGLDRLVARGQHAEDVLAEVGCDVLFRLGWDSAEG
jgi:hypothetical protein